MSRNTKRRRTTCRSTAFNLLENTRATLQQSRSPGDGWSATVASGSVLPNWLRKGSRSLARQ
ncbi:hypothetical protein PCANC_25941 [Puccinia coronata f. sp. avenae]|uniref:Uncharacterized protein n=1 Tax=Puccinia coronata f. sp. avenae TaxID=200324 RepID=A0A2N5U6H0_9BASI|nr:hypothetical protein PCANC_25941 [Puccinia coronata f. sp. avenae]